jgi:hypothetical protein
MDRSNHQGHHVRCEHHSSMEAATYLVDGARSLHLHHLQNVAEPQVPQERSRTPLGSQISQLTKPGPQTGLLQETVRSWDKWFVETDIMDEPQLRCYLQDPAPPPLLMKTFPAAGLCNLIRMLERYQLGEWVWRTLHCKNTFRIRKGMLGEDG